MSIACGMLDNQVIVRFHSLQGYLITFLYWSLVLFVRIKAYYLKLRSSIMYMHPNGFVSGKVAQFNTKAQSDEGLLQNLVGHTRSKDLCCLGEYSMCVKQLLVIVLLCFVSSLASANDGIEKDLSNYSIVKNTDSGKEISSEIVNIIIALDSSDSMDGKSISDAKNASKSFILKADPRKTRIGLVSWNNIIENSIPPTSDFTKILTAINQIDPRGRTCIGLGLNEAINLLEDQDNASLKFILLLSDGEENCTRNETPCIDAERARNLGIIIYTIGVGPSSGKEVLTCMAKKTNGEYYYARDSTILQELYDKIAEIIPIDFSKDRVLQYGPSFNMVGQGGILEVNESNTNVTVEKLILKNDEGTCPKVVLRITTPPIEKVDFVVAVDSSGSIELNNDKDSVKGALKLSINDFINKISEKDVNARISILSWDNNIDFAYGNLNNNAVNKTHLVSASIAQSDLEKLFDYYSSGEEEGTDFSVGIGNSLLVLQKNPPIDSNKTFRCIVLLAGRGEFSDINSTIKQEMTLSHHPIYTIGLYPGPLMERSLRNIAESTGGKYIPTTGTQNDLISALKECFADVANQALNNTPVARRVIIVDSLYPYLRPELDTIKGASLINFNDTTNTMILEIKDGLLPGKTTEVSFDTSLSINLPVEISRNRTSVEYKITESVPISNMSYIWHTNIPYTIELPENIININSGKSEDASQNLQKSEQEQSGLDLGFLTLISFFIVFMQRRLMK